MWVLLLACYTGFVTDAGTLEVTPSETLVAEGKNGFDPKDHALLLGTEVCIDAIHCNCEDDLDVTSCYDAGCFQGDTVGTFEWAFEPLTCSVEGFEATSDSVQITVIDPEQTSAELFQWVEHDVAPEVELTSDPGPWTVEPDDPFRVVDGGYLRLPLVLRDATGRAVAWDSQDLSVEVVPIAIDMDGPPIDVTMSEPGWIEVRPAAGSRGIVQATLGSQVWDVAEIEGVDLGEVDSIEIVAGYLEDEDWTVPLGARAIVRDAEGGLLYGLPIDWRLRDGKVALSPGDDQLPGEDYAMIRDECTKPGKDEGIRTAKIEAIWGGIKDEIELEWAPEPKADDDTWGAHPDCPRACGCATSQGPAAEWITIAALFVLRRRATRARTSATAP